jgi:hypothetical protein
MSYWFFFLKIPQSQEDDHFDDMDETNLLDHGDTTLIVLV